MNKYKILYRLLENEWVEALFVSTIVLVVLMFMGTEISEGEYFIILLLYVCITQLRKIKKKLE